MTIANRGIQKRSAQPSWVRFITNQAARYQNKRRTAHALNGRSAHLLKDVGMTENDVSDFEKSTGEQGKDMLAHCIKERSGNW